MNISPAKLAAATTINIKQSTLSPVVGPFCDIFQVPQGKVGVVIGGCVASPDPGGLTGTIVTVSMCDQTFNYGNGPNLGTISGKVDPVSIGVALNSFNLVTGTSIPFNDEFDFSAPAIAIPAGWFIRVCVANDAAPPSSGVFSVLLICALIDECDC